MDAIGLFYDVQALVDENFRLSWMDPESHFFCTSLEFTQHVLKLFFSRMQIGARRQEIYLMFVRQSWSLSPK